MSNQIEEINLKILESLPNTYEMLNNKLNSNNSELNILKESFAESLFIRDNLKERSKKISLQLSLISRKINEMESDKSIQNECVSNLYEGYFIFY